MEFRLRFIRMGILSGWNFLIISASFRLSSSFSYCISADYNLYYYTLIHSYYISALILVASTIIHWSEFRWPFCLIFPNRCVLDCRVPLEGLQLGDLLTVGPQARPALPRCHPLLAVHFHDHHQKLVERLIALLNFLQPFVQCYLIYLSGWHLIDLFGAFQGRRFEQAQADAPCLGFSIRHVRPHCCLWLDVFDLFWGCG